MLLARAAPIAAADASSASYRLRFSHPAAVGPARAAGGSPSAGIGASGVSLGQAEAIGPSGASGSLRSHLPGFWSLRVGAAPSLDTDGDGVAHFLDDDDDGDGLPDASETDTGVFVSPLDTGTNRLLADSDGDGADDASEVAAGTDPNDPESAPGPPAIPALPAPAWWVLGAAIAGLAGRRTRR